MSHDTQSSLSKRVAGQARPKPGPGVRKGSQGGMEGPKTLGPCGHTHPQCPQPPAPSSHGGCLDPPCPVFARWPCMVPLSPTHSMETARPFSALGTGSGGPRVGGEVPGNFITSEDGELQRQRPRDPARMRQGQTDARLGWGWALHSSREREQRASRHAAGPSSGPRPCPCPPLIPGTGASASPRADPPQLQGIPLGPAEQSFLQLEQENQSLVSTRPQPRQTPCPARPHTPHPGPARPHTSAPSDPRHSRDLPEPMPRTPRPSPARPHAPHPGPTRPHVPAPPGPRPLPSAAPDTAVPISPSLCPTPEEAEPGSAGAAGGPPGAGAAVPALVPRALELYGPGLGECGAGHGPGRTAGGSAERPVAPCAPPPPHSQAVHDRGRCRWPWG